MTGKSPYELTDEPPEGMESIAGLYDWSLNFGPGEGPFALFLDMLGWSQDELGEPIYNLADASLGYLELDKLADALKAYADRPNDVRAFVGELMEAESAS